MYVYTLDDALFSVEVQAKAMVRHAEEMKAAHARRHECEIPQFEVELRLPTIPVFGEANETV